MLNHQSTTPFYFGDRDIYPGPYHQNSNVDRYGYLVGGLEGC